MKILDKTTQTYKELVLRPGGDTLPVGSIIAYSSDTIPNGWLLCDGSSFSATSYPELFEIIGVTYGYDDERNPKLPDLRGRVVVGKKAATSSTDTDFSELGKAGGEKAHTLTVSEMANHTHDVAIAVNNTVAGGARYYFNSAGTTSAPFTDTAAWSNSLTAKATGGGQAHNNLQPYLVENFIIKAKNTVVIKGEIIQENDTASENNTYSAKAIDNKLKTNITTGQEVATNEYEDGKQVFVKKIDIGSLPNATRKTVETGLSNVKVTKLHGIARNSTLQIPLPFVYPELPSCIGVMFVDGSLYINTGSNRTDLTGEITIYYTKNT